ncbi:MAG: hypothetical protein JF886_16590 [Candidatus Dormibacteraeota bacterium]|uniref:Uncharacterized protein n=1 Tax=Candidatus Aeolococcus gillhamiae TaxID=3127015 RepID=A0A934K4Y6_9BACT|nr:hypothetical protein [Candidatus Dormibacteraeota bacterium]
MTDLHGAPRRPSRGHLAALLAVGTATVATMAALPVIVHASSPSPPGWTHHTVDPTLAGGEPLVTYYSNNINGADLAYTSHEGTTHLFRDGLVSPDTTNLCATPTVPPQSLPSGFVCSYTNQVNVWTSTNQGSSWQRTTVVENGVGSVGPTSPFGVGFSDPDWSTDEGGWLYNTGIDLANDAVFASHDGARSFPVGNNNCHSGDRPWLAGGTSGQVYLATDTTLDASTSLSSGHEIFRGVITNAGGLTTLQCQGAAGAVIPSDPSGATGPGILDYGNSSIASRGGTYTAAGKLFYDHNITTDGYHGALIEPAFFTNSDKSSGVGISILPNANGAFATNSTVTQFPQQFEVPGTNPVFAHWPSIGIDANDRVYLVWDTTTTDLAGNLVNAIKLSTFDLHNTSTGFTTPITITSPGKSVFWPWVAVPSTAAGAGNVSVVWYQYDGATQPDSGTGNVSLLETSVFGADTASPTILGPNDPIGAPIHNGGMCQSGTTCVATGQDRRLGDFFTNSVDQNGCVMIASGETTTDPSAATSRPLFIQQTNGTSLTGQSCAVPLSTAAEAPLAALFLVAGAGVVAIVARRRRQRQVVVS